MDIITILKSSNRPLTFEEIINKSKLCKGSVNKQLRKGLYWCEIKQVKLKIPDLERELILYKIPRKDYKK